MHTTSTMCRKKKRGVSTIMGTIIFIGIMFTSVIPMLLVMKQADNRYTQKIHEMEYRDRDRADEELHIYAFPDENDDLKVSVENKGVQPVTIKRVWINNTYISLNKTIAPSDDTILGPFDVPTTTNGTFDVKTVSSVANIFASMTGPIYFDTVGGFLTPELGIQVHISTFWFGRYRVRVKNSTWNTGWIEYGWVFGDFIETFNVSKTGNYEVSAQEKKWFGGWQDLDDSPVVTSITYPYGPPIVTVVFKG